MKRICCLILACCMLPFLTSCGAQEEPEGENRIKLYYVSNSGIRLEMHEYAMRETQQDGQIREVIEQFSTVPEKLEYKPPFTMGFTVLDYTLEEGRLTLDLGENYRSLSSIEEVLVRAALVRSFTQMEGVDYVAITVSGEPLHDSLGNVVGLMTADQFVDKVDDEISTYEKARLKLYFANETGDALLAVNRTLAYNANISLERLVIEQILAGPGTEIPEAHPTVNPDTKLVGVTVRDGICYVNLDQTFLTQVYNVTPGVTIYSIVNSLTELGNIQKVQILINGESNLTYRETYTFTTIFERNLDLNTRPE